MEFDVYFSNYISLRKQERLNIAIEDDLLDYAFVGNYHCFKFKKPHRFSRSGVEKNNDEIVDTRGFLIDNNGKQIISLSFIFVNTANGYIYGHNCSAKRFKEVMFRYFLTTDYTAGVDVDKLEAISNIELTFAGDPRLNQYNNMLTADAISINDALDMNDAAIEKATVKIFMSKPSRFSKDKLRNLIRHYENITIKGHDLNDNMIRIAQEIQLIIKIDLVYDSIEDLNSITFAEIISKIEKKYKTGGLSAYRKNV